MRVLISLSRKRAHKTARQSFMSSLMTKLSGDFGNSVAQAYVDHDADKFEELMSEVTNTLKKQIIRGTANTLEK